MIFSSDDGTGARALRLKSGMWVGAYLRRCTAAGAYAAISRRGDDSAGAIFLECIWDGGVDLWGPAITDDGRRAFGRVVAGATGLDVAERMGREVSFDPDLWQVTVEDRAGRVFLEADEIG